MSPPEQSLPDRTRRRIERFVDARRVEHDVPGLSIAVATPEGVVYEGGFGARDIAAREPATAETLYSIGSVTKVYTALAVLRLATEGRLDVDDEIREYTEFWNEVPGDPITIAELLAHASGVPTDHPGTRELLFADRPPGSPIVTPEDTRIHANAAAAERRLTDPDHFMYNTRGYQILGRIVRHVSGRPFADYVEEALFEPLGMDRSQVGYGSLLEMEGDVATGYAFEDGEPVPNGHDLRRDIHPPHSGGGILSSAREMAATARCLLRDGVVDSEPLVDAALVDGMFEIQSPTMATLDGGEYGVGYGPRVVEFLGEPLAYHTGTAPGISRAYLGAMREAGLGVALGANTADVPIGGIGHGVLALLCDEEPVEVVPQLALREKCRAVAGTYEGFRGAPGVAVEPDASGTHIRLSFGDGADRSRPAFPTSTRHDDRSFYLVGGVGATYPVTFHETDDGLELRFDAYRLTRAP